MSMNFEYCLQYHKTILPSDCRATMGSVYRGVRRVEDRSTEKTEILNVYLDSKTAAKCNGYIASSALDNPVKLGTLSRGFVYVLYEKCADELKRAFTERATGGRPVVLFVDGIGQYDGHQQLVREFSCKYECVKQIGISDKTLTKSIERNEPYYDMYYRRLGKRIEI